MQHGYVSAYVTRAKTGQRQQLAKLVHNELVDSGRSWMHDQVYRNTAAGTQGSRFIAVSETLLTIPTLAATTLVGEITGAGGLARAAATTNSYNSGTNTTTLAVTYTASTGFTNVQSSALFNQLAIGGTMTHHANFSTGSGTLAANDTLTVTFLLTLQ